MSFRVTWVPTLVMALALGACAASTRIDGQSITGGAGGSTSASSGTSTATGDASTTASASGAGGSGPVTCSGGATTCGSACVDLMVDPAHCGACDKHCPKPTGSTPVCVAGTCAFACTAPMKDCNAVPADGCETDSSTSQANCGACGSVCPYGPAHGSGKCDKGTCKLTCETGFDNCNGKLDDGCEANLSVDGQNCGKCGVGCNTFNNEFCLGGVCKPVPYSFAVLEQKDIVYQGIGYLLLKVKYLSNTAVSANWCQEYTNLCQSFGYKPTGCGQQFNFGAYGDCKTKYLSDGVSDSLGCNPSGGVASAAQQNGYFDANSFNSFAFHACSDGSESSCGKTMCSGQYCNSALSYMDYTQAYGYTLCKK